ncbi:MAG: bifunctional phosphopantothenoylcysteine decarboxylase/phosphopantothenate--cysteine ligase CoaBC [Acidiferrobacterales bacterium]
MGSLVNKRVVLGVTGGIAAYKSADLARRLRDAGAEVRAVMTQAATEFITPLTMQAVSANPVHLHMLDPEAESGMGHIELARWADVVLIAPASANFVAKLAQGRADDLLSTICLASKAPVAIAPAMNQQMWENAATEGNLATVTKNGVRVFGPAAGDQACGEIGPGRMLEPVEIVTLASELFATGILDGLHVIVTAGPTWEPIDPVRGISNRSSGKMGYAVAEAAVEAGARVILITGPTTLMPPEHVTLVRIMTAQEMYDAVHANVRDAEIFIGVAAVCDYRPVETVPKKIKKTSETLNVKLLKTPDVLASVAALSPGPFTVGFAAETNDLEAHARKKLVDKQVDLVAANDVSGADRGFEADQNRLLLIDRKGTVELPLQYKSQLARALIQHIGERYHAKGAAQDSRYAHR